MDNNEYTKTFGDKYLDKVLDDFVKGIYTWKQVKAYMEWNGFDESDVDVAEVLRAHSVNQYIKKKGV